MLSISSTPYPSYFNRALWHSTSELHPGIFGDNARLSVMRYCGGGWSHDKEESQVKAIVEAVERWAFFDYSRNSPKQAGIDLDPSSNGFAAIPSEMGAGTAFINAYCEAVERWILNSIWDSGNITLESSTLNNKALCKMFKPLNVEPACFTATVSLEPLGGGMPALLHFSLCLLKTVKGGAIAGAACSTSQENALERAALEAYLHAVSYARMLQGGLTHFENIIEKRLFHFAEAGNGYATVAGRLKVRSPAGPVKSPQILFSRTLPGAWEPEVCVHRVLLRGAAPILDGGVERFFI